MKKIAFWAMLGAFAIFMTSCPQGGGRVVDDDDEKSKKDKEEEVEAEYYDETYDIDDAIDPNDEEAFAKYASEVDEEEVEPQGLEGLEGEESITEESGPSVGSSDADILIDKLESLIKRVQANPTSILNEYSELMEILSQIQIADLSEAQTARFEKLGEELSEVMD